MYLAQVSRYDILYAVNQLARGMYKPSKAHIGAAQHLVFYLAGSTDFFITYKQGRFKARRLLGCQQGQQPRQRQINIDVHRHARERPNQF